MKDNDKYGGTQSQAHPKSGLWTVVQDPAGLVIRRQRQGTNANIGACV